MGTLTTSKTGTLTETQSNISLSADNKLTSVQLGQIIPSESVLVFDDNARFVITFDDGTVYSTDGDTLPQSASSAEIANLDALDEIEALQALIASGEDPTAELPETAAGTPTGNQGDSGFVSLARTGDETIANAGFNTAAQPAAAPLAQDDTPITLNDIPSVLVNDSQTIAEDTVATGNVLDNDSDIDSDLAVVSFEVEGQSYAAGSEVTLENGVLVINADGSYTFTPNENWNGQVPVITYTTNTGLTATLTIEVTPVDDASVLANDSQTIAEDTVATGNVLDNDSDVDSDLAVVSFEVEGQSYAAGSEVTLENGVLVINADGSYTFTPNENWNGSVPVITYTTNTGLTATLNIEVTPVDDTSVLANDNQTIAEDTVATGNVLDNDSDVDSDLAVVSFEVEGQSYAAGSEVTLENGVLVLNADGSYTFTPNENWNGQVPVITYTTNTGLTATLNIEVTPVDDASVLANDSQTIAEDTVATGNVLDNDSDVDSDLAVVSFEVEGQSYAAGTEVTLENGMLVLNADGSYTFTPNENWNGQVPVITYTTNTGITATLTIEVTPVDDPTVAQNDTATTTEDTPVSGNVLDNDNDPDSDLAVVSFEVNGETYTAGNEVELEGGVLVINADGSYTFTPNENWNGQVPVITYTTNTGTTATLTIEVTPVGDPATITVNDTDKGTVTEDGNSDTDAATVETVTGKLDVTDVDNGEAVFQVQTNVADGNYGTFSIDANGNWTYTLNNSHIDVQSLTAGQTLVRTITVTSSDGTASHNVLITIVGANDPADITVTPGNPDSDKGTVTEDGNSDTDAATVETVTGKLDVTDVDNGEAVFQVQTNVADGNYGSFSIDANGNWTYVLNNDHIDVQSLTAGQTLTRDITVTSKDGTATHTVTITIVGANDPADISVGTGNGDSDKGTVTEDGASDNDANTVQTVNGKLDVTDVDTGEAIFQVQTNVADGNYGTFSIDANGNWTYTLNNSHIDVQSLTAGQELIRSITVTSADGTATHTVTITIVGTNDAPEFRSGSDVAGDTANVDAYDFGSLNEGANVGTIVGTVIADDPDTGDKLTYSFADGSLTNGVFTINATTGVITLNQDIDDADLGAFNFNVLVTDSTGKTDTAAVTIDLSNVNDAPDAIA
ncbi:retention module-containing protein, partial [Shewanella holmiensis]